MKDTDLDANPTSSPPFIHKHLQDNEEYAKNSRRSSKLHSAHEQVVQKESWFVRHGERKITRVPLLDRFTAVC